MTDAQHKENIRDEWGAIDASFIADVEAALRAPDHKQTRQLTRDLHAADLADHLHEGSLCLLSLAEGCDTEIGHIAADRESGSGPGEHGP